MLFKINSFWKGKKICKARIYRCKGKEGKQEQEKNEMARLEAL